MAVRNSRQGALHGMRVLDTATLYAGPLISTLLADHGADVIKVEPPGGDPYRTYPSRMWPLLARNKRSVVLDLGTDEGARALRELIPTTDVIVLNMPLPLLARRGLDHETLAALNPRLVIVQVSGFGMDGPYAGRPGNGTLAEAFVGLTHMTGDPDGPPMLSSLPLGDAVTGLAGAFAVLAACYGVMVDGGSGQVIDVNPVDALLHVVGPMLTEYDGVDPPGRLGGRLVGSPVRNVYPCADGAWVAISLSTPRHLREMAALLHHSDGDGGPADDLDGAVRRWTSAHVRDDVIEILVAHRLPVAPVNTARELVADPHVVARRSIGLVHTSESGNVLCPAPAPRLLGTPATLPWRTPGVGEHTDDVLGSAAPA